MIFMRAGRLCASIFFLTAISLSSANSEWHPSFVGATAAGGPIDACRQQFNHFYAPQKGDFELAKVEYPNPKKITCTWGRKPGSTQINPVLYSYATLKCPSGHTFENGSCTDPSDDIDTVQCPANVGVNRSGASFVGDPIDTRTGNVTFSVTDLLGAGAKPLNFTRTFHSRPRVSTPLGQGWTHNYYFVMKRAGNYSKFNSADGVASSFYDRITSGSPIKVWLLHNGHKSRRDNAESIRIEGDYYIYTDDDGKEYYYDVPEGDGSYPVRKMVEPDGYQIDFVYGEEAYPNDVTEIVDSFGRRLTFEYATTQLQTIAERALARVSDDSGAVINFDVRISIQNKSYDGLPEIPWEDEVTRLRDSRSVRLFSVTYPDFSVATYEYLENSTRPLLIATSGNPGMPAAFWEYDFHGRGTASFLTNDVERVDLEYRVYDYNTDEEPAANLLKRPSVRLDTTITSANGLEEMHRYWRGSRVVNGGRTYGYLNFLSSTTNSTPRCAEATKSMTYDRRGFVETRTSPEGIVTHYVNSDRGRVLVKNEAYGTPDQRTTTYEWHETLPVPTKISGPMMEWQYEYDSTNRIERVTQIDRVGGASNRQWQFTWLDGGLLNTVDGPLPGNQDLVDYDYDASGNISRVTDETGRVYEVLAVDPVGRPTSVNDFEGVATDITYNTRGWPVQFVDIATGGVTTVEYNSRGLVLSITYADNTSLAFVYDLADRLVSIENGAGDIIRYSYDAMSNVIGVEVSNGNGEIAFTETRVFDELNRLRERFGGANQLTTFEFDRENRVTQIMDPASAVTGLSWNALDQLTQFIDEASGTTQTIIRVDGEPLSLNDPEGMTTSYTRNGFGDVLAIHSPDSGTTNFTVDQAGRTSQRVDARGQITNYSFDGADRITSVDYVGHTDYSQAIGYDYSFGRLVSHTHKDGQINFEYDARGNISSKSRQQDGQTYDLTMTYDSADKMTSMTYPSGLTIEYSFDAAGRIADMMIREAGGGSEGIFTNIMYDGAGVLRSAEFANGRLLTRTFDTSSRLIGQSVDGSVQELSFGYDGRDNITSITDGVNANRSQTFGYDALSRLTMATGIYGSYAYEYDAVGNRTRRTSTGSHFLDEVLSYGADNHRLSQVSDGASTRSFTYFSSGQLQTDSLDGVTTAFDLDPEGRVKTVTRGASALADYVYDGFGLRVSKTVPIGGTGDSGTIHFIYDLDGRLLAEHDGATGLVLREYVYFGLMPVAMIVPGSTGSDIYAIHTDQVNMPQKLTDASGAIVYDRVITPFGEGFNVTGSLTQTLRFPGQRKDMETGFFQNWHRDYDASLGRYVQSDPIGLSGGINTYAYATGNPLKFVDPSGLDFKSPGALGNGQFVGPIPANAIWVVDLPKQNGNDQILCGCGDTLPDGPIDADFFYLPTKGWTKIVTGSVRFSRQVTDRKRPRAVSRPWVNRVGGTTVTLSTPESWWLYGQVPGQYQSPGEYLGSLRSGGIESVGGSCLGIPK